MDLTLSFRYQGHTVKLDVAFYVEGIDPDGKVNAVCDLVEPHPVVSPKGSTMDYRAFIESLPDGGMDFDDTIHTEALAAWRRIVG